MSVIAAWITKIDFTMLNDRVVPVGDVDRSIRSLLDVNRTEGNVLGTDQVRLLPCCESRTVITDNKPADAMSTEVVSDQIPLPVVRQMSAIHNFQSAILRAARIQSMQNSRNPCDGRVRCPRHNVVDPFTPGAIRRKRLPPAIKCMTPGIHPAAGKNFQLHRLGTELPDPPGIQPSNTMGSFDVTVNVDRLVHVQHAIHAPAERMQDVVSIFRSKTTQHDPRFISLVITVGILEMNDFGAVGDIGSAIPRFNAGRDQEPIGKDGRLVSGSITIGIFEDQDLVRCLLSGGNLRIDLRRCHPQSAARVKVDLDRLVQLGICGEQIDFKSFRKHKRLTFLFRIRNWNVFEFSLCVNGSRQQ